MTPQKLDYINGARFVNYSGQIIRSAWARPVYYPVRIGCNCSGSPVRTPTNTARYRHAPEQRQG